VTRFHRTCSCLVVLIAFLAVAGCRVFLRQTALDEAAVKEAATGIEQAVLGGLGAGFVLQDKPNFKVGSTELSQIIQRRQSRVGVVAEFKQKGCLGESADGLITYVKCPECQTNARLHNRAAQVILSENDERWRMYETLARENHLSSRARRRVQRIFHQARIDLAHPGDLVQLSPGSGWTKKADEKAPAQ